MYRLLTSPVLAYLIFSGHERLFAIFLTASFFTDMIDGFFARRFRVTSVFGSRLDSLADDLTFVAAAIGIFVFHFIFVYDNWLPVLLVFGLYLMQNTLAIIKYGETTSFHTYLAKTAALMQGLFFIAFFWTGKPSYPLFYTAIVITTFQLVEEIILTFILSSWRSDVKGICWVMRKKPAIIQN